MIERKKKIHFCPQPIGKSKDTGNGKAVTAALNTKNNALVISTRAVDACNMRDKFVRFYYDPSQKIIGWRIRDKLESQEQLKQWKLCKPNPKSGVWSVSMTNIIKSMRGLKSDYSYKGLEVQKYREMSASSEHRGELFYFVEIKEPKDENKS